MQIKETNKEELKREFKVTLTAAEIDEKINDRLKELGKTMKIPGFRPGKVPMNILKSRYGQSVMGEVLERAVNDSSIQAIQDNELRPAMQPKVEITSFEEGKGLEYTMAIELLPEIELTDFSKLKLEKLVAEASDKEVDEAIERIAANNKSSEPVKEKRASKTGDIVVIDFDGSVDGERRDGMAGNDFHLELGTNSFIDTFEDQLTGKKVGDHVTVNVTFPDPYGSAELAGKDAVFEVDIKEIRKVIPAKIDEEFAKSLGMEGVDKLKEAVKDQIQGEYAQISRTRAKRELLDILDDKHKFKTPAGMVDAEFEGIWQQVKGYAHDHVHGPDCDHGEDHDDKADEADRKEYQEIAERRVKLGLVLAEVGRQNNIEVSQQELQLAVVTEARRYPGQEKEVFDHYQNNQQALEALRAPIYEDKVIDFILEIVKPKERIVTIEELTEEPEEGTSKPKKSSGKKTAAKKASGSKKKASEGKKETKKKETLKKKKTTAKK